MVVRDLINIFLRLEMASKEESAEIVFADSKGSGSPELYNVKDGGTHDRYSNDILMVSAAELTKTLMENTPDPSSILHFESGTINFTINSVYPDADGCFCLESNEIEELDNYPVSLILEELSAVAPETAVYFYDDEAAEYYGIYLSELRTDEHGDLWINVR